jgi:predicted MFS family arabinose efflux permease
MDVSRPEHPVSDSTAETAARSMPRQKPDEPIVDVASLPTNRLLLLAICMAPAVGLLSALAYAPFLPVISRDLGTSIALLGQIPATTAITGAALGLVAGPVADHLGHRRILVIGTMAVALAGLVIAFAPTFAVLFVAALFSAVGRSIIRPVSITIASIRFAGDARRRAFSSVTAVNAGGAIVGVPLLTTIEAGLGWRAAFAALALLALAVTALALRTIPPDDPLPDRSLRVQDIVAAYGPLLRHRPTLGLIVSNVMSATSAWAVGTYIVAFLVEEHGLSIQAAGLAFVGIGAGIIVGSAIASGRIGQLPPRPLVNTTTLLSGLFLAASMTLPIGPAAVIAAITVSFVIGGVGHVSRTTLLADESPAGRATTMSLSQTAVNAGNALGSSLGGLLLALAGYSAIGLGALVCSIIATLLIWFSRARAPMTQPA